MKMAIKLCVLSLLSLEALLSTTEAFCMVPRPLPTYRPMHGSVRKLVGLIKYCQFIPSSRGNFKMEGSPWHQESKTGITGERVVFNCSTNDPNAAVQLQYEGAFNRRLWRWKFFEHKWHDVMTSSKYPKGSVVQNGQVFTLKKYGGQRDKFRCKAWSQGKSICMHLGHLSSE